MIWRAARGAFVRWSCADGRRIAGVRVRAAGGFSVGHRWLVSAGAGELGTATRFGLGACVFQPRTDKVKILWYDRHGWWLMYKRLERGRFSAVSAGELSEADLRLVLEGVDLSVRRLKPVRFERVA